MGHIKRCDLEISKVKIPSKQALVNLDKLFSPIFNRMVTCRIENRKLSSLRDTLLPKLMSGEISVEEVSLDQLAKLSFIGYLCVYFNGLRNFINFNNTNAAMKEKLIDEIKTAMRTVITADQMSILCNCLLYTSRCV